MICVSEGGRELFRIICQLTTSIEFPGVLLVAEARSRVTICLAVVIIFLVSAVIAFTFIFFRRCFSTHGYFCKVVLCIFLVVKRSDCLQQPPDTWRNVSCFIQCILSLARIGYICCCKNVCGRISGTVVSSFFFPLCLPNLHSKHLKNCTL